MGFTSTTRLRGRATGAGEEIIRIGGSLVIVEAMRRG